MEDVSAVIFELEIDAKGIPVLLRHYLKLDATLISFNEDRAFSNVVDGLIWVDLSRTGRRLLKRYRGDNPFEMYARHYGWKGPKESRAA